MKSSYFKAVSKYMHNVKHTYDYSKAKFVAISAEVRHGFSIHSTHIYVLMSSDHLNEIIIIINILFYRLKIIIRSTISY